MSEVLAHVTRGGMVECIHRGDLAIVDTSGNIIHQIGDPYKVTYWRSAAKPFQLLPLVEVGGIQHFSFTSEELALMTSSHSGEERHVATTIALLGKLNQTPDTLECGTAAPLSQRAANELLRKGQFFNALTNSCSGKHCNMIALALLRNYKIPGYSQPTHPVQLEMLRTISDMTGLMPKNITIGIDGCGVPVFGMPLYNMAIAYAHLANPHTFSEPRRSALQAISSAMIANPYFVAGTSRLDTVLMEASNGRILAKLGAEGVYSISIMDRGLGLALKVEDGNIRAIGPVIIEILSRLGFLTATEFESLRSHWEVKVKNHRKETIGTIKAVF